MAKTATRIVSAYLLPGFLAAVCWAIFVASPLHWFPAALLTLLSYLVLSFLGDRAASRFFNAPHHSRTAAQQAKFLIRLAASLLPLPLAFFAAARLSIHPLEPALFFFGAVAAFLCRAILSFLSPAAPSVRRGAAVKTLAEILPLALRKTASQETFFWGGAPLPKSRVHKHFLVVGATGSGKTLTLRRLMQDLFPDIQPHADRRANLYDPKTEFRSLLPKIGVDCPVISTHPFDARSAGWAVSRDFDDKNLADAFADNLVPKSADPTSKSFFTTALRSLLTAVAESFICHSPREWSLRDVVYAMGNPKRIEAVLGRTHAGRDLLAAYFGDPKLCLHIMATANAELYKFRAVAAAWQRAQRRGAMFSLTDWLSSGSILLLGNDYANQPAIEALNSLLLYRTMQLILALPDSGARRIFMLLDEVKEAGRLPLLPAALTNGRSKGLSVTLAFQSIQGLRAVWGKEIADEMCGQCYHKALLKAGDEETARWQSDILGKAEYDEQNVTVAGTAETTTHHLAERQVVLPSEFSTQLPETTLENGLTGYYLTGCHPPFKSTRPIEDYLHERPAREVAPNLVRTPPSAEEFPVWTEEDLFRLDLLHARHLLDEQGEVSHANRAAHELVNSDPVVFG